MSHVTFEKDSRLTYLSHVTDARDLGDVVSVEYLEELADSHGANGGLLMLVFAR